MRYLLIFIFSLFLQLVDSKLCSFFKNNGLICNREAVKGLAFDKQNDRLISYGLEDTAILWDLIQMNDLKVFTAQNSQIVNIFLDQDQNQLIILNQNGFLTIQSYPQGQTIKEFKLTDQRVAESSFFHPSLPYSFIISLQNKLKQAAKSCLLTRKDRPQITFNQDKFFLKYDVQVFNYNKHTLNYSFMLDDKIAQVFFYDRTDYYSIIMFLQNKQISLVKIQKDDITKIQTSIIKFNNQQIIADTQSFILSINSIVGTSEDRSKLTAISFDYNSVYWDIQIQQAQIVKYLILEDAQLITIFLSSNKIQTYSLRKGAFLSELTIPSVMSLVTQAYHISLTKQIVFHDQSNSLFICPYKYDGSLSYMTKRISFQRITNIFQFGKYIMIQTRREEEGFYIYNSIKESLDSIKCLVPQTNLQIQQFNKNLNKKANAVFDYTNQIIIRFYQFEIDAWNYSTEQQIFYDDSSLKRFVDRQINLFNEILEIAIDNERGLMATIQLDKTIAIWDYWSGILIALYQEIETPAKIFYSINEKQFIVFEKTKIIIINVQKDTKNNPFITRDEFQKTYNIISVDLFMQQLNLFITRVYKIDISTQVKTEYLKFYYSENLMNQKYIYLSQGYMENFYDQENKIMIVFNQQNIQIYQIEFIQIDQKLNINNYILQTIQLIFKSQYKWQVNTNSKILFLASNQRLLSYNYINSSLISNLNYSKQPIQNIQLMFIKESNTLILHNDGKFFLMIDSNSFQTIKGSLSNFNSQILSVSNKQTMIFIVSLDQRVIVLDSNNLSQPFNDILLNQQVSSFIDYEGNCQIAFFLFKDGTIGKLRVKSPLQLHHKISIVNQQIYGIPLFQIDEQYNSITFNQKLNGQNYFSQISIDNMVLQKYVVKQQTWDLNQIAEITFYQLLSSPLVQSKNFNLYEKNPNEVILAFQYRINQETNETFTDMFLYDYQNDIILIYKKGIHSANITIFNHGVIQTKGMSQQIMMAITYCEQEKSIKLWNELTLDQINPTLKLDYTISQFITDFNLGQIIYTYKESLDIYVYSISQGRISKEIKSLISFCTSLVINYELNILLIGESVGRLQILQYTSFVPLIVFTHSSEINFMQTDKSQNYLIVGTASKKIFVYERQNINNEQQTILSYELKHELQFVEQVRDILIQNEFKILFTVELGQIKVWNLDKGNLIDTGVIDNSNLVIENIFYSIYSRLLIICTKSSIYTYNSLKFTNPGFMLKTMLMKKSIQQAVYFQSNGLLIYSQIVSKKSIGTVEFWDTQIDKFKLIHQGFICKTIQIINASDILVINCQNQLLAVNSNELQTKPVLQFKTFQIRNETIVQFQKNSNFLYGINRFLNKINLYAACIDQDHDVAIKEISSYQFNENQNNPNEPQMEIIKNIYFLTKDFLFVSDSLGQLAVLTADLKQTSNINSGSHKSQIQGVKVINLVNNNMITFLSFDKKGIINKFTLQFDGQSSSNNNEGQNCFNDGNQNNQVACSQIQFQNIKNLNLSLVNSFIDEQIQLKEILISEESGYIAFLMSSQQKLQFIDIETMKPWQSILIPLNEHNSQIILCNKSNIILVLTDFQVNVYQIKVADTQPNKILSIVQSYFIIDAQLGYFKKVFYLKNNVFMVTCQKGYQIIQLMTITYQQQKSLSKASNSLNIESRQITYLNFPIISNLNVIIDELGNQNILIRGYHEKGLMMHTVPIVQVQEKVCYHNILENDFLIIQKTLKFLETTYDSTINNFDSFYITINLNMKQKLKELPDLTFKYNSTLHFKGLSNEKKNLEISFLNNSNQYSYDLGLWNTFIIENIVLLPKSNQLQQDKNYSLQFSNSLGLCQNISFVNIDFYFAADPTQKGISPPSNKYTYSPIQVSVKNISTVNFMNVNYKYQKLISSSGINIINSQIVNLNNINIDSCILNNSQIIKIYTENLQSNRALVSISQIQVTRSILSNSEIFCIDNSNQLSVEDIIIKYSQGISSQIFFITGISNHQQKNSNFYLNTGISYLYHKSAISLDEVYSYDYQISNSLLNMTNILMYNNNLTNNLMTIESGQTVFTQVSIRNIKKITPQQNNFIQEFSSISGEDKTEYPFHYDDLQDVTLHFESKTNLNTFLLTNFNQSQFQNSMSIPNILIEYNTQVNQYLLSSPDKIVSLITFKQPSKLTISNSFFENVNEFEHLIFGQNIDAIIDSSVFRNIESNYLKGVVFLSNSRLKISNSIFRDNRGYLCTSIYIQNSDISSQAVEIKQSTFHKNTAKLLGGAICGINVVFDFKRNIFSQNSGLVGGGIYYYYFQTSQFIQENIAQKMVQDNKFLQNECKIFGKNIGSRPIKIQTYENQKNNGSQYTFKEARSGQFTDLNIVLLDDENGMINIQETPQVVFVLSMQNFYNLRMNDYSAIQLQYNDTLKASIFKFTNQIIGIPNKESSLEFYSASIPTTNNQINQDQNTIQNKFKLNIQFRDCQQGEVYSQDTFLEYFTCRVCSDGLYSLIDPKSREKNSQKCMLCPPQAKNCSFNQIQLNPGYWRMSKETDQILECVNNPENCAGNDQCMQGHTGPLCEDCDIEGKDYNQKYSKINMYSFDCVPCSNELKQYILIGVIIFLMSFYLLWSVKQTIERAKATIQVDVMRKIKMISLGSSSFVSLTAAYIKIANDYFQIISGLKQFSVRYTDFNLLVDYLGDSFSQTSFSLDCFLINNFEFLPLNYSRILWIHLNAIFYLIIFALVYKFLACLKVVSSKFYIWTNVLILYSLFTQYSIMQILISSISCRKIGSQQFVKLNISMQCWGKDHLDLFVSLILPLLLIQLFSLVFKLYLLISIRKKLNNYLYVLKYGLLYLEYTPQNYFWEIVKIFKRILVTVCINMFAQNNQIKGIMSTLILLFYYMLLNKMQPFRKRSLNRLEKYSTLIQLLLYFLAVLESQNDIYQTFFSYFIFSINYLFISLLIYKVVKKNKNFVKFKFFLNSFLQKKFPKIFSCIQKYFKTNQSQTRILWRNLAWVVGNYLKRRKKDKKASMFPPFNQAETESTQRYKLKDMRSSMQLQQYFAQSNINTTEINQPQITKDLQQHQSIFPEAIQNSTTLEMVSSIEKNLLYKKKSLHIQDSINIEDNNNTTNSHILKRIPNNNKNIAVGGISQSISLKKSIILKNSLSQNGQLQQKVSRNQGRLIKILKTNNSEIASSIQQTTIESDFDKNTLETEPNNKFNQDQNQQCIPSEYNEETDSIFIKYNTQYGQTIKNLELRGFQIKKTD